MSDVVIAIAGSSGLIGSALVYALRATDRRVLRIVRRAPSNADEVFWNPDTGEFDPGSLVGVDAVVNLCGVNVGDKRWSGAFKQSLRDSRIGPTEVLSAAVADAGVPVLINASAVGYYGNTGSRTVDETAPAGDGFLAQLSQDWEAAVAPAEDGGARVVLLRSGLVLTDAGGVLGRLKLLFSLGLGARLGNGRQYMPWISLEDEVRAILFAITHEGVVGSGEPDRTRPGHQRRVHHRPGPCSESPHTADGAGLRIAGRVRRVRRRRPARRAARHTHRVGARRIRVPPQHDRRGAGIRDRAEGRLARTVKVMAPVSIRSVTTPIDVRRLGTVDYRQAWQLQRELADARIAGGPDTLLLLEHPSVYTAGKRTLPEERPGAADVPVIDTDRGGKITWHGPGQLVGYPVIGLAEPLDVVNFVRRLEESLITVCADLGLETCRIEGRSGVWVAQDGRRPARKVAAVGIRVSRSTTLHGFALNCDCDLSAFSAIVPCGISDAGVTSLTAELGQQISVSDVVEPVAAAVADALDGRLSVALTQ